MKILFPVEVFYPSQAGGPANSVYYLTKYLDKNKFEPVIVATDKGLAPQAARDHWTENESGRVIFLKTRNLRFPLSALLATLKQIRSADVVHVSSIFFPTAFLAALAASVLKKKLRFRSVASLILTACSARAFANGLFFSPTGR